MSNAGAQVSTYFCVGVLCGSHLAPFLEWAKNRYIDVRNEGAQVSAHFCVGVLRGSHLAPFLEWLKIDILASKICYLPIQSDAKLRTL